MPWVAPTLHALVLSVASVPPAPVEEDDPQPEVASDARDQAEALYLEGIDAYETADYPRAIELFEAALRSARKIEDHEDREHAIASMQYNIARTHVRAYELDGKTEHLRVALTLLEQFAARVDESERASAEALQRDVQRMLEAERKPAPARPRPSPTPEDRGPHPATIAGAVLLPLAGAGAGVMIGGLVMGNRAVDDYRDGPTRDDREDALRRGRIGNGLAIGGGVAAGVLAITGTVLLVVGARKRSSSKARVVPGPTFIVVEGRF